MYYIYNINAQTFSFPYPGISSLNTMIIRRKNSQYNNRVKLINHYFLVIMIMPVILFPVTAHSQEISSAKDNTRVINKEAIAYPVSGRLRFSFQNVRIANNEIMGLYSFHYDLINVWQLLPGLFFSIGGYGAVTGERGGFFVGGYGAGYNFMIFDIFGLEAGLFFGGGGGGGAPQGSGLMLQQYIAFQIYILGVGFQIMGSNIDFPNGDIGSRQIAVGCVIPIESWVVLPVSPENDNVNSFYETGPFRMLISPLVYFPRKGSRFTNQAPLSGPVGLIGFGMEYYFRPKWFTKFSFYGAFYGGVDGYAQMLGGLGFAPFSIKGVEMTSIIQAGAGGGGAVQTGGGFLIKPSIGIRAQVWQHYGVFFDFGYTFAPDGLFGAWSVEAGLIRDILPLSFDESDTGKTIPGFIKSDQWKIVVLNKTFLPVNHVTLKSGVPMEMVIHLVGFSLYHPITRHLNWTGQAFGAWYGGIGGYAEGLLGFEVHAAPFRKWQSLKLSASILGGAAGGGGADVGSGIVWEASGGIIYKISNISSIMIKGGFFDAVNESFQGVVIRCGLSIDFSIPVLNNSSSF